MVAFFPGLHLVVGGFGGSLAVLGVQAYQNRDFDRLPTWDRLRVLDARRTGTSTGDGRLDAIARRQLDRAARSYKSDRVLLPIFVTLALASPVIAAGRTGSAWWLLLLLPMVLTPARLPVRDPRPRLATLEAGTAC